MLFVFLSVCCSVIVSIQLKLAKRYHVDVLQAIMWNYAIAIVLTWLFLKPDLQNLPQAPFTSYVILALLLPSIFFILAKSVRLSGIVRTDIAQRLSLLIPIIAAFFLFNEPLTPLKGTGIALGFIAILCAVPWRYKTSGGRAVPGGWFYLLLVFIGFGVIDVLFKQMALFKAVTYTTSLFIVYIMSFIFSFIALAYQIITKKTKFSFPHIIIGSVLGIANFGNILFYLKAHKALASSPSVVFAGMNFGVIILGALTGFIIFKEKLSLLNKVGIGIALLAVAIIAYTQLH